MDLLTAYPPTTAVPAKAGGPVAEERLRVLQRLGVLCGVAAGAWLGAAEVPAKLVSSGLSPVLVSLVMVLGVFLGRWTLPAIVRGTSQTRADFLQAPHLVIWAILAGCLWAVANTLTIFAIRDLGLSIAFPLWNTNAIIGIAWGVLFFGELKNAGWARWSAVSGGAVLMFCGGVILARVSANQISSRMVIQGVAAALGAGVLWGTMYIPYRKAYLSGMNPLSFVSFFTIGELGMMAVLSAHYIGGAMALWQQLRDARHLLFWLLGAGFVWVIGDIFQQYAVKYIGVSRGIPLSNSNQLWGLLWGALAFGELRAWSHSGVASAIYGSILMAGGLAAISFSVAGRSEHEQWRQAAEREGKRYRLDAQFVSSALEGKGAAPTQARTWFDWLLVAVATAAFVATGVVARWPSQDLNWQTAAALSGISLLLFAITAAWLWKATRFN
ncbi:MAG TPA: GRP family sugar transporter [Candidatus Sulfotelmatobacter sp.]